MLDRGHLDISCGDTIDIEQCQHVLCYVDCQMANSISREGKRASVAPDDDRAKDDRAKECVQNTEGNTYDVPRSLRRRFSRCAKQLSPVHCAL